MYRPGGFPEYSPAQQDIFDQGLEIITRVFRQRNYQHIHTPAVEPVEILKKGGDIIDKQVYGLFGLAQGVEDVKEYALHYDLTIPFARYVLDHMNELTFPFKRYQIQPVRRGERTKRGRFKEFRQFDVDTIRRAESSPGVRYDAESYAVVYKAVTQLFAYFHMTKNITVHISHIGLVNEMLKECAEHERKSIVKHLDNYHKQTHAEWCEYLQTVTTHQRVVEQIITLIEKKDLSQAPDCTAKKDLQHVIEHLNALKVPVQFDLSIVRGHGYYSGSVVEFFDHDEMSIGALCGGGAYDRLTDFIDPKHSFSGVGCSLSSRIFELIFEHQSLQETKIGKDSYLMLQLDESLSPMQSNLLQNLHQIGRSVDLYPVCAKMNKQFEYAEKRGNTHVIFYGENEQQKQHFIVKNLKTGEQHEYGFEYAYGIALVRTSAQEPEILMVKHNAGHRGIPKGHLDPGEDPRTGATRELLEETGISVSIGADQTAVSERYINPERKTLKQVTYFVVSTSNDFPFKPQQDEIQEIQRMSWAEASKIITHPTTLSTLRTILF